MPFITSRRSLHRTRSSLHLPEVRLILLATPLELLWEMAQYPLYNVWHNSDWREIGVRLAHCTAGDIGILLAVYISIALLTIDRHWYQRHLVRRALAFTLFGVGYTVFSEILHVHVDATWGYTARMPIVPGMAVGLAPLLQWMVVPPTLLYLMRRLSPRSSAPQQIRG